MGDGRWERVLEPGTEQSGMGTRALELVLLLAVIAWLAVPRPFSVDEEHERAKGLRDAGHYRSAIASYSRILARKPSFRVVWEERADCYAAVGQRELALVDYKQAMALGRPPSTDYERLVAPKVNLPRDPVAGKFEWTGYQVTGCVKTRF